MKKITLVFILSLVFISLSVHSAKRVLFIGNSYTGVNDLPNTFYNLCLSLGDTVVVDVNSPGGFTFNGHTTNATTLGKIAQGNWDYVVLQEQSQIPSFSPTQVATDCFPYAKKLCDTIKFHNPCAEVLFYMTWGRKNGDAGNCPNYPPVCTYAGMQQRLRESYLEMADSNNVSCSPVGAVWNVFRTNFPNTELYNADESHPSVNGTYLAACTFYSSIFHKPSIGSTYLLNGVTASDASNIQTTATQVVLDSLEKWQQHGNIPFAKFAHTITGNNVAFTNQSLRYTTTHWNFGDGNSMSNNNAPAHTYASTGNYIVTLTVQNDSCIESIFKDTIIISSVPTILPETEKETSHVFIQGQNLKIADLNSASKIEILSINGQMIMEKILGQGANHFYLPFAPGLYFYRIFDIEHNLIEENKILVK